MLFTPRRPARRAPRQQCRAFVTSLVLGLALVGATAHADIFKQVEHGHADSNGVRIHYATLGSGPLVVMIHGFPDFWYSWRHQMAGLADHFQVVAIDQRGYNRSGQPSGVEQYSMRLLVGDVAAVVRHLGKDKATIVGHDWGGAVAWQFAFALPQMVDKLIVLNLPHPAGMGRELANNPEQRANSDYARVFREKSPQDPDVFFGQPMTAQTLSGWVTDADDRKRYVTAFERSDFAAMLNYYKSNYPTPPPPGAPPPPAPPKLTMPVLVFHGLKDTALHSDGLNNTWDWIDADLTIVTAPGAGHFVQQDAAELVTSTMKWWLLARQ